LVGRDEIKRGVVGLAINEEKAKGYDASRVMQRLQKGGSRNLE